MLQGEHSAIRLTFIKLPYSIKTIALPILKWPLKTGFTLLELFRHICYLCTCLLACVEPGFFSGGPRLDGQKTVLTTVLNLFYSLQRVPMV